MSEVRLIDANALLESIEADLKVPLTVVVRETLTTMKHRIKNAPTITAEGDGDAISRSAAINAIRSLPVRSSSPISQALDEIRNLPSIPVAPAEVVTAEDVCAGIVFDDGQFNHRVATVQDAVSRLVERDGEDVLPRWVATSTVAAMLNAAESITWPPNHRLAKPEEPTLLELAKEYVGLYDMDTKRGLELIELMKAAIKRAEAEGESK